VLELKEDKYKLEDITILCRTNKQASLIARHLSENQINVISSESLLLSASPAVNFLLAALQYLANPHDSIARTEILKFLIDAGHLSANSFPEVLMSEQYEGKEELFGIPFPFQKLLNLPLYELIEELIRRFGLKEKFDPYIQFFLDTIIDYTSMRTGTITDFLDWWNENDEKHSIIVSEGQEAVQVMTIHKAKGLEFPVVIYPFVDRSFSRDQMDNIWVEIDHEDIPELIRKFLVLLK